MEYKFKDDEEIYTFAYKLESLEYNAGANFLFHYWKSAGALDEFLNLCKQSVISFKFCDVSYLLETQECCLSLYKEVRDFLTLSSFCSNEKRPSSGDSDVIAVAQELLKRISDVQSLSYKQDIKSFFEQISLLELEICALCKRLDAAGEQVHFCTNVKDPKVLFSPQTIIRIDPEFTPCDDSKRYFILQ